MLTEFSFLRHPLEKIMRFGKTMVPGIERIDVIFFDPELKKLVARTLTKDMEEPFGKIMEVDEIKPGIEKLRRKRSKFEWMDKHDLPWNSPRHENINKGLLKELEKFVLMIPVKCLAQDNMNDLVLFYFNENLSNLLMTSSIEVTITEKDLVGSAYKSCVQAMVKAANEDSALWSDFAPAFENNGQTMERLRIELQQMRGMYRERLIASCSFYLAKMSREYGKVYEFSAGAIELISQYEGEYFRLENAIKVGVRMANMLNINSDSELQTIHESYLNFNTSKRIEDIHDIHLQSEMEKPFNYLNQLNEVCENLRRQNLPLTGKNVAERLNPPVKAATITMRVQSNQKKILKLFNFYPEKWKLLRTDFKPTSNLIDNSNRSQQK